jgi:hypothetical protein
MSTGNSKVVFVLSSFQYWYRTVGFWFLLLWGIVWWRLVVGYRYSGTIYYSIFKDQTVLEEC